MKARTLERLDLLAAEKERRILEDISRHQATLAQIAQQRSVLSAYRQRLSVSWRDGAPVTAGQARSAGHFVTASQAADTQIDQMEARARQQLAAAFEALASTQAHRHSLEDTQAKAARIEARSFDRQQELALPWRKQAERGGAKP
jgi:flagellar biosynthesis chaperone FliJ